MKKKDKRIGKRKALRSVKPNDASATRDTMKAQRRHWGAGHHVDSKVDPEGTEDES